MTSFAGTKILDSVMHTLSVFGVQVRVGIREQMCPTRPTKLYSSRGTRDEYEGPPALTHIVGQVNTTSGWQDVVELPITRTNADKLTSIAMQALDQCALVAACSAGRKETTHG